MRELHEQALDALAVKPDAPELKRMRQILGKTTGIGSIDGNVAAFAAEIDPPLTGLITVLRQELAHFQRQHQLKDQQVAQAPPAYRPAVADYFEQLSRDYATDKPADGTKR